MLSLTARAPATPFYYGWLVLAASAISEMLVQGASSYSAALFVLPLQAEFHLSRAAASSPVLILFLGAALGAPLVGRALDRFPIRMVVAAGAIIFSAAFAAIAMAHQLLLMAFLLLVPAAIGFLCLGPMTTATLTSRWFWRHRGLALGIAAVATSGGGFTVVPLLSLAIQKYGWRTGLVLEAIAMLAIILVISLLVLRDNPFLAGLGDHPENHGRKETDRVERAPVERLPVLAILGSRAFWIPCLVLAAVSGTAQALIVTLVPYGVSLGLTLPAAAAAISGFAIAAALTKIVAGILADHINQGLLLILGMLIMTMAWSILIFSTDYSVLYISAILAGIALGCTLPTVGVLIANNFGSAHFGAVMGWGYLLLGLSAIGSTLAIGSIFDHAGSYRPGFMAFTLLLACLFVATLVFPVVRKADRAA